MKIHYQKYSSFKVHLKKHGDYTMNRTIFLTIFSLGYAANDTASQSRFNNSPFSAFFTPEKQQVTVFIMIDDSEFRTKNP